MNVSSEAKDADAELKAKHRAMWASGDYPSMVETFLLPLGPRLVEGSGIGPGMRVLDVAAGTGNAAIPAAQPPIERLLVDPDGTLYVKPFGAERTSFDVFDADGRFLGQVKSDVRFLMLPALPRFYGDRMYGVVRDSVDVQYVVRARVDKRGR